jgi:hypothetical protein
MLKRSSTAEVISSFKETMFGGITMILLHLEDGWEQMSQLT